MAESPIYLDTNATTPVDPEVAEAMLPYLTTHFGNPSSGHAFGTRARAAVEEARRQVASFLGGRPEEVVFTSGGTEGINTVVQGVARALRGRGRHVVTTAVEHPAVLEPCAALEAEGFRVTRVGVDAEGRVDPRDVAAAIGPETILVSVMHANNEVGTLQPVGEIARIARERGVLVHTDAAQSAGKVPVDVAALGVDFLTLAGHKLYAPKGVGALWIRSGVSLPRLLHGASHEGGRRAGTENVLEIVGLGKACEVAARRLATDAPRMEALRERLFEGLSREFPDLRRNSPREGCLPNTLSVGFRGLEASTLLAEVGDRVAASAGAACHAAGVDVSTVLTAMKVPLEYAMGTVRFSVGRWTTEAEVDEAVQIVSEAVRRLSPVTAAAAAPVEEAGPVRLTRYTHGMGCACKLRPQDLETVLRSLPRSADPAVLVGPETSDDAAVYRLTPYLAIVSTVDFFTPIADDPFDFGAVSAANSLSDVYAMGGKPLFALSVVGFPARRLPLRVLDRILAGAAEVARRIVAVMRRLNRAAAESTYEVGVSAATDVTGFGLLGHLREMAAASGLDAEVEAASVPVIDPAREMAASDAVPGGTLENLAHVSPHVDFAPGLSRVEKLLLADAQTSGGLLIAVPEERSDALLASLREKGVHDARRIGRFTGPGTGRIRVD